jgi:hypothetical protein
MMTLTEMMMILSRLGRTKPQGSNESGFASQLVTIELTDDPIVNFLTNLATRSVPQEHPTALYIPS